MNVFTAFKGTHFLFLIDTVFTAIKNTKSKENSPKINISPYFIDYLTK